MRAAELAYAQHHVARAQRTFSRIEATISQQPALTAHAAVLLEPGSARVEISNNGLQLQLTHRRSRA
jgi:hypothetical protein